MTEQPIEEQPRCPYSDLHVSECAHCDPSPRSPRPTFTILAAIPLETVVAIVSQPTAPVIHIKPRVVHRRPEGLLEYVIELCDWTRHDEPYQVQQRNPDGTHTFITMRHVTTTAPLLHQLGAAMPTSGAEDGGGINAFESKSPARDDAIATLMAIDKDTSTWLRHLEGGTPRRDHRLLIDAVRHLGSVAVMKTCGRARGRRDRDTNDWCCTGHEIEGDLRTWYTQARITTGWDSPAWKPANTCPLCGTKGGLRVRLEEHSGMCVKCRETWTPESIGLLADHIRSENHDNLEGTQSAEEEDGWTHSA